MMVRKSSIKNIMLAPLLAVVMLVGFDLSPAYGQSSNRAQVLLIPLDVLIDNLDCGGELIHVTGKLHITSQTILDAEGNVVHSVGHLNWAGVTGEGVNSGTQYRMVNSFSSTFNVNAGSQDTQVTNFQFIAFGPDKSTVDLRVHANFHITLNANGELTAEVSNFTSECR